MKDKNDFNSVKYWYVFSAGILAGAVINTALASYTWEGVINPIIIGVIFEAGLYLHYKRSKRNYEKETNSIEE
jgi:hypothetical protein